MCSKIFYLFVSPYSNNSTLPRALYFLIPLPWTWCHVNPLDSTLLPSKLWSHVKSLKFPQIGSLFWTLFISFLVAFPLEFYTIRTDWGETSRTNKFISVIFQVATLNWWFCGVIRKVPDWEMKDLDSGSRTVMN